MEFNFMLA